MPKQRVTSRQVAKHAGVSQTTVSFVLNAVESANISHDTRQRVLAAARELGYFPDAAARSLARGRSSNIGLLIGQPHNQIFIDEFLPTVITGLTDVTRPFGFRLLVEIVDERHPDTYTELVRGKEVAGLIVSFSNPSADDVQRMTLLAEDGVAVVTLDYWNETIPSVSVDKLGGVRKAVAHLAQLGHERIALISYAPPRSNPHATRRLKTYRETLRAFGLPYDEQLAAFGAYNPESGYEAMQSLLSLSPIPTALFAMNDMMAFGAMAAIEDAGLRVPDDIAIVGFDDIRLARFANPPLTTIREPDVEHGRRAGELLLALINGTEPDSLHSKLETELVIRASCGFNVRQHLVE
jgi:DNA-binding LacI/PurR family transcriptional regulator